MIDSELGEIKSEEYYKSRVDEIATACFDVILKGVSIEPNGQIRWRIAARVVTSLFANTYKPAIETIFTGKPISREVKP
jgi:hypothetical protein